MAPEADAAVHLDGKKESTLKRSIFSECFFDKIEKLPDCVKNRNLVRLV